MKKEQRDREHAIKSYLKGETITAIAKKLGRTRPWVYKWIERYQAEGQTNHWQEDHTMNEIIVDEHDYWLR